MFSGGRLLGHLRISTHLQGGRLFVDGMSSLIAYHVREVVFWPA
jgi:hypothetical protein